MTEDDTASLFIFGGMEDRWDEMAYGPGACVRKESTNLSLSCFSFYEVIHCAAVFSNELHRLNVITMVWTKLGTAAGTPPTGRGAPGFAYWGGKLFVFGGWNFEGFVRPHLFDT